MEVAKETLRRGIENVTTDNINTHRAQGLLADKGLPLTAARRTVVSALFHSINALFAAPWPSSSPKTGRLTDNSPRASPTMDLQCWLAGRFRVQFWLRSRRNIEQIPVADKAARRVLAGL
jgi:hypothetical protein